MTDLIRNAIGPLAKNTHSAHAGLLLARGLPTAEDQSAAPSPNGESKGQVKADLVGRMTSATPCALYELALKRWQTVTADPTRFQGFSLKLAQRMFIGLGNHNALETSVSTQHSYGMPTIPGSALKGLARAHAARIGMPADYQTTLFGNEDDGAGCLVWHDAWWVGTPDNAKPFVREVVTVHHPDYYAGKGDEATDYDSPVPNAQIAVQGAFYFAIEGDPAWAGIAASVLKQALQQSGIGAKRAAGYGAMAEDATLSAKLNKVQTEALRQAMSYDDRIRTMLNEMDEDTLAKSFGSQATHTRKTLQHDEDWLKIPAIALEIHGALIATWAGISRKQNKDKFKAYKFFSGGEDDQN